MADHAHGDGHGHEDAMHEHAMHGSPEEHEKHYKNVYFILLALLVASVAGPFIADAMHGTLGDLGRFVLVLITAFGIAFVKAYLVVKNFMHLNLEPKYVAYLTGTSLAFMLLFFFFVAPDVMKHEGENWDNVAAQEAVERGVPAVGHHGGGAHGEEHGAPHEEPIRLEERRPAPAPTPGPAVRPTPTPTPTPSPTPSGEVAEGGDLAPAAEPPAPQLSEAERRQRAEFIRRQLRL